MSYLEIKNFTKSFGGLQVLKGIDISIEKSEVLKAFGAHIFFDDQSVHTDPASKIVPAARVPYKNIQKGEQKC